MHITTKMFAHILSLTALCAKAVAMNHSQPGPSIFGIVMGKEGESTTVYCTFHKIHDPFDVTLVEVKYPENPGDPLFKLSPHFDWDKQLVGQLTDMAERGFKEGQGLRRDISLLMEEMERIRCADSEQPAQANVQGKDLEGTYKQIYELGRSKKLFPEFNREVVIITNGTGETVKTFSEEGALSKNHAEALEWLGFYGMLIIKNKLSGFFLSPSGHWTSNKREAARFKDIGYIPGGDPEVSDRNQKVLRDDFPW